jgi:hypothetical protein
MKASNESCRKWSDRLASSFSLTEKPVPHARDRDEHSQTGILTSASYRLPAFPLRNAKQWLREFVAVTVAQPSRIRTGFPDV